MAAPKRPYVVRLCDRDGRPTNIGRAATYATFLAAEKAAEQLAECFAGGSAVVTEHGKPLWARYRWVSWLGTVVHREYPFGRPNEDEAGAA